MHGIEGHAEVTQAQAPQVAGEGVEAMERTVVGHHAAEADARA